MITIVIPVYKAGKTLEQTLESVLAQTYSDYEVLLAEDCSPDGSGEIIRRYVDAHPNFRSFCNECNRGVAFTRNEAVKQAAGEWIAFLDSDDCWTPDKLEKQMALVEKRPDALLYFTGSSFLAADGTPLSSVLEVPEQIGVRQILKQNRISCSSVLLSRETALAHPFPEAAGEYHEDFACWISVLKDGGVACAVNEPLLLYRLGVGKTANKVKAAVMNWRTYGIAGLRLPAKIYYMAQYAVRSVLKYADILLKGKKRNGG